MIREEPLASELGSKQEQRDRRQVLLSASRHAHRALDSSHQPLVSEGSDSRCAVAACAYTTWTLADTDANHSTFQFFLLSTGFCSA